MANPRGNPKNLTPWQPGQSGNPLGRSIARTQLDSAFIGALLDDFRAHGAGAIEKCRQKHVAAYLNIIARSLPRELAVEVTKHDEESMRQIDAIVERFRVLQEERRAAIERLEQLGGAVEGCVIEG